MNQIAPIALFVYNRIDHAQKTVAALSQNKLASISDLFVYSDAPKGKGDVEAVQAVREWLPQITGFKKVHYILQRENIGLANSIIQGVSTLVEAYGKVIVVEDDLVTSPYFLTYLNDALNLYESVPEVASIHAYALPLKETLPETYFMRGADCWGWATWQRAWQHFEADGLQLLNALKANKLNKIFDFDHTQPNMQMLADQIAGKNNSWAIRWHASTFLKNMVTLYPNNSLVNNIGFDQTGQHCAKTDIFETAVSDKPVMLKALPAKPNPQAYAAYVRFFKQHQRSLPRRIASKIKQTLLSII